MPRIAPSTFCFFIIARLPLNKNDHSLLSLLNSDKTSTPLSPHCHQPIGNYIHPLSLTENSKKNKKKTQLYYYFQFLALQCDGADAVTLLLQFLGCIHTPGPGEIAISACESLEISYIYTIFFQEIVEWNKNKQ